MKPPQLKGVLPALQGRGLRSALTNSRCALSALGGREGLRVTGGGPGTPGRWFLGHGTASSLETHSAGDMQEGLPAPPEGRRRSSKLWGRGRLLLQPPGPGEKVPSARGAASSELLRAHPVGRQ